VKKTYTKPAMFLQSLAVAGGVSPACSISATFAERVCPVDLGWGETVYPFPGVCDIDGAYQPVCYDIPDGANNVFQS